MQEGLLGATRPRKGQKEELGSQTTAVEDALLAFVGEAICLSTGLIDLIGLLLGHTSHWGQHAGTALLEQAYWMREFRSRWKQAGDKQRSEGKRDPDLAVLGGGARALRGSGRGGSDRQVSHATYFSPKLFSELVPSPDGVGGGLGIPG